MGEIRVDERTIHGRIQNADRQPVVGARVFLQPRASDAEYARLGSNRNPNWLVLSRVTYTDRAGRYRFQGVIPGEVMLGISAASEGFHTIRIAADHRGALDITIPKGGVVTGRVVMPNGKPAAHAHIQYIFRSDGDAPRFSKTYGMCYLHLAADAEGKFVVRGLPEHSAYTCYALHADKGVGYRSLQTGSATPRDSVEIVHTLAPHPARK